MGWTVGHDKKPPCGGGARFLRNVVETIQFGLVFGKVFVETMGCTIPKYPKISHGATGSTIGIIKRLLQVPLVAASQGMYDLTQHPPDAPWSCLGTLVMLPILAIQPRLVVVFFFLWKNLDFQLWGLLDGRFKRWRGCWRQKYRQLWWSTNTFPLHSSFLFARFLVCRNLVFPSHMASNIGHYFKYSWGKRGTRQHRHRQKSSFGISDSHGTENSWAIWINCMVLQCWHISFWEFISQKDIPINIPNMIRILFTIYVSSPEYTKNHPSRFHSYCPWKNPKIIPPILVFCSMKISKPELQFGRVQTIPKISQVVTWFPARHGGTPSSLDSL